MSRFSRAFIIVLVTACSSLPTGCDHEPPGKPAADAHADTPAATNRVDIPAAVRQNLGITFAKVESRHVARTLRVPGRFELLPTARREYRAVLPGRVELLVTQYQQVTPGMPLYRLESPRWREMQGQLNDAHTGIRLAQASTNSVGPLLAAHEKHHQEIDKEIALWSDRVRKLEQLRAAGTVVEEEVVQARAALAASRTALAETLEKEAGLEARRVESAAQLESAKSRYDLLLATAASITGQSVEWLSKESQGVPGWRTLMVIEVQAAAAGIVESLPPSSGTWLEDNASVAVTVQPRQVRFVARALQSDLGRLSEGMQAAIVAPTGGSLSAGDAMEAALTLAPTADPHRRTIELIAAPSDLKPWARAGVSAFLEVTTTGDAGAELAVPLACVARDGTAAVIFRRDPKDPNKAIRMEADLGLDDGKWIVIKSGVKEGDEIVSDGVYQLMVATSGSITKGGHFHPDGTFHEGED